MTTCFEYVTWLIAQSHDIHSCAELLLMLTLVATAETVHAQAEMWSKSQAYES